MKPERITTLRRVSVVAPLLIAAQAVVGVSPAHADESACIDRDYYYYLGQCVRIEGANVFTFMSTKTDEKAYSPVVVTRICNGYGQDCGTYAARSGTGGWGYFDHTRKFAWGNHAYKGVHSWTDNNLDDRYYDYHTGFVVP